MEEALARFIQTGRFSFKSFAASVINEILKTLPPVNKMQHWINQFEFGDTQLFGPTHLSWRTGLIGNLNEITEKLSNSNLKFFITCHSGPEELQNIIKVWPNAQIIMLKNYRKFYNISSSLKSSKPEPIENHAGNMPVWLAPTQAVVLNISGNSAAYAQQVQQMLKKQGFRVFADLRNEKIGFKIRERTLERIPYMIVMGDKEVESNQVNVRTREGDNLGVMSIDAFIDLVNQATAQKGRVKSKTA